MVNRSKLPQKTHNEMLVEIQNSTGEALRLTRHDDGHVTLGTDGAEPQQFHLMMMHPDLFALRTSDTLELLTVDKNGRLLLKTGKVGTRQTFQLVRGADTDTHFGFRVGPRGAFFGQADEPASISTAKAANLDSAARFTFSPVPVGETVAPAGHNACCCGPAHDHSRSHNHAQHHTDDQVGAMWNDYTHFRIVEMAVHYLRHMENPTADARFVSEMWDRGFRKIAEGLKGADYWPEWMPDTPFYFMYYYHFFNPDTGGSFAWPASWYPDHAVSRGGETFDNSVRLYREGPSKYDEAFVHLGLSLHYLTDLCQPMHAANFINNPVFGDWRHSGYEKYAEDFVQNRNFFRQPGGYPPIRRDEIEDTSPTARGWLLGVAQQSLATWKEVLGPATGKKFIIGPGGHVIYLNEWTAAEADPSLMRSLWLAPRNTARYLCMWASRVRQ